MSGIFDFQVKSQKAEKIENAEEKKKLLIHMPNSKEEDTYVKIGPSQVKRVYEDAVGARLLIVVDEVAELLMPTKVKSEAGKAEDALKQEVEMLIQSITQLGRSGGIHMILCTQRNDANTIS